jgi:hypothetical protein
MAMYEVPSSGSQSNIDTVEGPASCCTYSHDACSFGWGSVSHIFSSPFPLLICSFHPALIQIVPYTNDLNLLLISSIALDTNLWNSSPQLSITKKNNRHLIESSRLPSTREIYRDLVKRSYGRRLGLNHIPGYTTMRSEKEFSATSHTLCRTVAG